MHISWLFAHLFIVNIEELSTLQLLSGVKNDTDNMKNTSILPQNAYKN